MNIACIILQVQDYGNYPLRLDDTPDIIDLYVVTWV